MAENRYKTRIDIPSKIRILNMIQRPRNFNATSKLEQSQEYFGGHALTKMTFEDLQNMQQGESKDSRKSNRNRDLEIIKSRMLSVQQ